MRVAHIISVLSQADGHSLFCRRLCEELAAGGELCGILCGSAPGEMPMPVAESVPVLRLPARDSVIHWARGDVRHAVGGWLAEFAPDLVHLHGGWHPLLHAAAVESCRQKLPAVCSLHGMLRPAALGVGHWKKRLAWQLYQRHDLCAMRAVHAMTAVEAADPWCVSLRRPVLIVPMGVDLPSARPVLRESGRTRQMLYLGRIHPGKGLLLLLEAWARVRPAGWRLLLAGPDERGYKQVVRQQAAALGIDADLDWRGAVYGVDKEYLLAETDLLVLPSPSESFGAVVGEALAYGLPAIATTGAPWEALHTCNCGWWVAPDVTSLAAALCEAAGLPDSILLAMGMRGRELVATLHSWRHTATAMRREYGMLMMEQSDVA